MEVDSDYEFNAPRYIDFLSTEVENEHIDNWFDENPDGHEGGIRISQVPFTFQHSNFQAATRAISAALNGTDDFSTRDGLESEHLNEAKENETKPSEEEEVKAESVSVDKSVKDLDKRNEAATPAGVGDNATQRITRSQTQNQSKRTPLSAFRKRKLSSNQNGSAAKVGNKEKNEVKKPKMEMKKPLITMPNTPSLLRRLRGKSNVGRKTTEALEMDRIKALQNETKKRLKENESVLQKVLAPQTALLTKRAVDVTKTVEFTFATDARIKTHQMDTRAGRPASGDFVGQLRKHPPSPIFKNKKLTKPQPFKFTSSTKTGKPQHQREWKSVASSVNEFQSKTPERWRSRPANQQNCGPDVTNKNREKLEITHPKTPQLTTKARSRPLTAPSQADAETKIVEDMKHYKFKARDFDHRLVELNGMCGVDQKKHLPVTEPKPFSFQSETRLEQRRKLEEKKDRIEKQQQENTNDKRNTSVDSNHGGKKQLTEPKPFSFENRDKAIMQKKQEKILKVYEEEEKAREFHARPLPCLSPDLIPVKSGKHTDVAPFNLATDERGALKTEKFTAQVEHERKAAKEKVSFKAKPCKVIHQEGFKVKPAGISKLTEINEFKLNTEERSRKRESYEIMKKELQRVKEDVVQQNLKERQEEEAKEVALLRKQAVHKANPIRQFGDFEIKPSERPLTMPETPKFETNRRFGKLSRI